jgi:hypothetical protein
VDALSVLAVDHEPGVTISPDGLGVPHGTGNPLPRVAIRPSPRTFVTGWSWCSPGRQGPARHAWSWTAITLPGQRT